MKSDGSESFTIISKARSYPARSLRGSVNAVTLNDFIRAGEPGSEPPAV